MARLARVVAAGVPHHVTQRGNARQHLLAEDDDRAVYLNLLAENLELYRAALLGYCLMSNHVHLVLAPAKADSLARTLKATHGRYASYWNAKRRTSGHAWQGRFYSCPLDAAHLWAALRYTELNPVRAGMVPEATAWPSSSAAAHCGVSEAAEFLSMDAWNSRWNHAAWRAYLAAGASESELRAIRKSTHTGRPLGEDAFVGELEEATHRVLAPRKGGRPKTMSANSRQVILPFD